jgi:Bacteriophage HK97-gp10, putative tail-component
MGIDLQEKLSRYGRRGRSAVTAAPPPAIGPRPSVSIRVTNLDEVLADLDNIAADVQKATRPAAAAAARVLYDEVKKNAEYFGEGYIRGSTGKLADAIYRVYSRGNSGALKATYHVSWNAAKAPHGHLVENGHWQPYLVRRGRNGRFYTVVKAGMLKEYLAKYRNKPVPKSQLDRYFVRRPSPKWVPARPFVRAAQSQFRRAGDEARDVIFAAVDQQRLAL